MSEPFAPVVVYVNGGSQEAYRPEVGHFVRNKSGKPEALDPHATHREFPQKWRAYLHAAFPNHFVVAQTFQVSERAARKWWNGEGGVNGGHVAVAIQMQPAIAPRLLFAAE